MFVTIAFYPETLWLLQCGMGLVKPCLYCSSVAVKLGTEPVIHCQNAGFKQNWEIWCWLARSDKTRIWFIRNEFMRHLQQPGMVQLYDYTKKLMKYIRNIIYVSQIYHLWWKDVEQSWTKINDQLPAIRINHDQSLPQALHIHSQWICSDCQVVGFLGQAPLLSFICLVTPPQSSTMLANPGSGPLEVTVLYDALAWI